MNYLVGYIGTYTQGDGRGKGIYSFTLDLKSGRAENISLAALSENPSYLALSHSGKYLYAVNETGNFEGKPSGAVSVFFVGEKEKLSFIKQVLSGGKDPCHIALNKKNTHAVVSNYTSGTISVFPLENSLEDSCQIIQLNGSGKNKARQESSHAHFFMFDNNCDYGFACDLGSDCVNIYSFNENVKDPLKEFSSYTCVSGAGPRHAVFNNNYKTVYVLNELNSTIDVLEYNGKGNVGKKQSISSLQDFPSTANTTAAIKISPCGNFLYASNRGHDSISVYKIAENGLLQFTDTIPSGGKTPRDFAVDPSGNFLLACHQDSDNLVIFRIEKNSGLFQKVYEYEVPSGVCIIFA